jgi:hypothetical protein
LEQGLPLTLLLQWWLHILCGSTTACRVLLLLLGAGLQPWLLLLGAGMWPLLLLRVLRQPWLLLLLLRVLRPLLLLGCIESPSSTSSNGRGPWRGRWHAAEASLPPHRRHSSTTERRTDLPLLLAALLWPHLLLLLSLLLVRQDAACCATIASSSSSSSRAWAPARQLVEHTHDIWAWRLKE